MKKPNIMDKNDILKAIELLEIDRNDLENQIRQINAIIDRYKNKLNGMSTSSNLIESQVKNYNISSTSKFPQKGKIDDQILFIFQEIKRAIRLPYLDKLYYSNTNNKRKIDNVVRRMKKEGKLTVVKYDNTNTKAFWGLPEWIGINKDGIEDYKDEFRPSEEDLPVGNYEIEKL